MRERIPLSELADVDIKKINKDDLVDVRGLTFDITVPMEQRAERVMEMVKNPYCYRVGKLGVKLEFRETAPPLGDVFTAFMIRLKCGL